jgi:tRNA(Ile)-lysidine synthase TilS/MesJ
VAEQKWQQIDWQDRERKLRALCDRYRRDDGRYDCVVPGSGGKDSFYAAHQLKYAYGMHPLTVTWAPHIHTDWGWRNFQAWTRAGFDNYLMTPNPRLHRLLTRLAVENLFHPFQPFILGQKNFAPKMALLFDVPLVFYGENTRPNTATPSPTPAPPSATAPTSPPRTGTGCSWAAPRSPT